jgi:acetoacetyl-CoA synthetase
MNSTESIGSRFVPFVQLTAGSEPPPIFIAHGLSGAVEVGALAKAIQTSHPIYGIQAKGIDGKEEPFDRVEDMAGFYLEALRELHPQGPYILIGYSFGGLVALEMAQRLSSIGKHAAMLVLLDAYPHPRYLTRLLRVRLFVTRVKTHLGRMRHMPPRSAAAFVVRGIKRRMRLFGLDYERESSFETGASSHGEKAMRRVKEKAYSANRSYHPKFYRGKINFVTTEIKSFFPEDPVAVWGKLAAQLEVEVVPGDHLSIVTEHYKTLAAALTRILNNESRVAGEQGRQ